MGGWLPLDMTFSGVDGDGFGCDELDCIEIIMAIEYVLNITIDDNLFMDGKDENQKVKQSLTVKNVIDYCLNNLTEAYKLIKS